MNNANNVMLLFSAEGAAKTVEKNFPEFRTASTDGELQSASRGGAWSSSPEQEQKIESLRRRCKTCSRVYFVCDGTRETELIAEQVISLVDRRVMLVRVRDLSSTSIAAALREVHPLDEHLTYAAKQAAIGEAEVEQRASEMMEYDFQRHGVESMPNGITISEAAALGMVAINQHDIDEYVPESYQQIAITYMVEGVSFDAIVKTRYMREHQAKLESAMAYIRENEHRVKSYERRTKEVLPPRPLTATALARGAFYLFNFEPDRTKEIAGELYRKGLITDPYTTGTMISDEAFKEIISYLQRTVSEELIMETKRKFTRRQKKKKVEEEEDEAVPEDVSEAIRPVYFDDSTHPDNVELEIDERKLYEYIWFRTVSTQLVNSIYDTTRTEIEIGKMVVSAEAYNVIREGWQLLKGPLLLAAEQESGQGAKRIQSIPHLTTGESLPPLDIGVVDRMTRAPGRYGVGRFISVIESFVRPQQLSSVVSSLEARGYIVVKEGMINITALGKKVASWLGARAQWLVSSREAETNLRALALIEQGLSADPDVFYRNIVERLDETAESIGFIPREEWPPTPSEAAFARAIAKRLGLDPAQTSEIVRTQKSCLEFIKANKKPELGDCPECKDGKVLDHGAFFGCSNHKNGCRFGIGKSKVANYLATLGKSIAEDEVADIVKSALEGEPVLYEDFVSRRTGGRYSAFVVLKQDEKWGWQVSIELASKRRSA